MTDIKQWLDALGLTDYHEAFEENDIEWELLGELTEEDLKELGVRSLGHRKRLLQAIRQSGVEPSDTATPSRWRPQPTLDMPKNTPVSLQAFQESAEVSGTEPTLGLAPEELLAQQKERSGFQVHLTTTSVAAAEGSHYTVHERLNGGNMGAVYLATQDSTGRQVVLKAIERHQRGSAPLRQRFLREVRATASLDHPHIVKLLDFLHTEEGRSFMVMEYVEGISLRQVMKEQPRLPFDRVARILLQVCDALSEAHQKGIIHRDLKPEHLILKEVAGHRDFVKVLDFGIARRLSSDEVTLTQTGEVFGTPRYISPEQVTGRPVSPHSDLYALGIILYEALAGGAPFETENTVSLLMMHRNEPVPPLPEGLSVPVGLHGFLQRTLSKNPAMRPSSAQDFKRQLEELLLEVKAPSTSSERWLALPTTHKPEKRPVVLAQLQLWEPATHKGLSLEEQYRAQERSYRALKDALEACHGQVWGRQGPFLHVAFGATQAQPDTPLRAVEGLWKLHGERPYIRASMAFGTVLTGISTGPLGIHRQIVGPPVERVEDLFGRAAASEIVLSSELQKMLPAQVKCTLREDGAYQLVGLEGQDDELPPFVGRKEELRRLSELLRQGTQSKGARVAILGKAGMGKSRLAFECKRDALELGYQCHEGRIVLWEGDIIQQLLASLLEMPLELTSEAVSEEQRVQWATTIFSEAAVRPEHWLFGFYLLGFPLPTTMQLIFEAMEPEAREIGIKDTLATLLRHRCKRRPQLLVVEDLQWASQESLRWLATVSLCAESCSLVLLMTSRPEEVGKWELATLGLPTEIMELGPLLEEQAIELLARDGSDSQQRRKMALCAGGHPLFLVELSRRQREAPEDVLPDSLPLLIQNRLDQLGSLDQKALQAASVLGPRITVPGLCALLGEPHYVPRALLDHRLLEGNGEGEYRFAHEMIRETIYSSLLEMTRKQWHTEAGRLFREEPLVAAEHYARAQDSEAPAAFLEAVEQCLASFRFEHAEEIARHGLVYAREDADRAELLLRLGEIESALARVEDAEASYRQAAQLAPEASTQIEAWLGCADAMRIANRSREAHQILDRAQELLDASASPRLQAQLHCLRGALFFSQGALDPCLKHHGEALQLARDHGLRKLQARALSGLGDAYYGRGEMKNARLVYTQCIELCRREGFLAVEISNLPMLGIVTAFLCNFERAAELGRLAAERAREISDARSEVLALGCVSFAGLGSGELEESAAVIRQAIERAHEYGGRLFALAGEVFLATALGRLGQRQEARERIEAVHASATPAEMAYLGATLLALLAWLHDDPETRCLWLERGEAELARGGLAFNRIWFHEHAMEAALEMEDFSRALRYADALKLSTHEQPIKWCELLQLRARAIVAIKRNTLEAAFLLRDALRSVERAGAFALMPALRDAL